MDKAYASYCRAGYVRAGVYIPIFENSITPIAKNAKAPTFTDFKKATLNAKPITFTDFKKAFLNTKVPSFTDFKRKILNIKPVSFTDIKRRILKYG